MRLNLQLGLGLLAALEPLAEEDGEESGSNCTSWLANNVTISSQWWCTATVQGKVYVPTKTMAKTTMTPTFLAGQLFARLAISCMTRPGWALAEMAAIVYDGCETEKRWEGGKKKFALQVKGVSASLLDSNGLN